MSDPPSIAFGWIGIAVSLIWKNLALAVLLVLGAYRSVDETFLEAARNFGASSFRQIKDILLPMSKASLAVAGAFMFTSMLASFSVPLMIGSGEPPQMVMIDVFYRINYQGTTGPPTPGGGVVPAGHGGGGVLPADHLAEGNVTGRLSAFRPSAVSHNARPPAES